MKFSLTWHEECLKNFNASLAKRGLELQRLQEEVKLMTIEANFRKAQIDEARRLNREDFDAEKFYSQHNPLRRAP